MISDIKTGEVRQAQVFIGVLGASNYTYAEASWSQNVESWVGLFMWCEATRDTRRYSVVQQPLVPVVYSHALCSCSLEQGFLNEASP